MIKLAMLCFAMGKRQVMATGSGAYQKTLGDEVMGQNGGLLMSRYVAFGWSTVEIRTLLYVLFYKGKLV